MSRTAPAIASILLALLLAVPVTVAQGPPRTAADSLGAAIEPLFVAAKYDSILSLLPAYQRRAEAARDSVLLGRVLTQYGRVALMQGRPDDAEHYLDRGILMAESVRDTVGLMPAVNYRGFAYAGRGDHDRAMRCYQRRLQLALLTHSRADEAWARSSMGYVHHRRNDNARAREEYTRAIELFRELGLERLEITPLIGLGRVESATGNEPEAIRCYQRAWVVAREVGDRVNEMWATNNLGVLEGTRGDLSRASQYQQRAYDLARELEYPYGLVVPAINLAARAIEMGDFDTADSILRETRRLCESQGAEEYLAAVDMSLANVLLERGRMRAAATEFRRLLANNDQLEPQYRDQATVELAIALAKSDSIDAAIDLLTRHLTRVEDDLFGDAVGPAYTALSWLYAEQDDGERALACVLRAREWAERMGRTRYVISAMLRESVYRRSLGQRAEAARLLYAAVDSLESFRGATTTPEWREVLGQEYASGVVDAGRVLLEYPDSLPTAKRQEAFFDVVQRVKTRTLLDRITEPRFAETTDAPWSKRVATLDDLQAVLAPGELLLDFFLGSRRAYLAAVTADSLRLVNLPGADSPLAERVQLFRSILATSEPSLREQYSVARTRAIQRALGRDVLGQVEDLVQQATRVIAAPDGFFSSLPLGVLIVGEEDEMLMAVRDIVQVPSSSVLVLQRSREQSSCGTAATLVAVSSEEPRLSGTRDEVLDLARRYGNVNSPAGLTGIQSFEEATNQCDILHVAAHALVVDRSPWQSGIRLSSREAMDSPTRATARDEGGRILPSDDSLLVARTFQADTYVRAWQIAQITLPAKLAVLSACETAGGRVTTGEGTLGLTAAFLSAGVPVVVSSLWPIDDKVTAVLMRDFYRHLSAGEPVATALRLAQLELSRSRAYSHPFFWAGFTVVGDGSMVVEIEEHRTGPNRAWIAALGVAVLLVSTAVIRRRRAAAPVG